MADAEAYDSEGSRAAKEEMAERGKKVVRAAGQLARIVSRGSPNEEVLLAAKSFASYDKHLAGAEETLGGLEDMLMACDSALLSIGQVGTTIPVMRAAIGSTVDLAKGGVRRQDAWHGSDESAGTGLSVGNGVDAPQQEQYHDVDDAHHAAHLPSLTISTAASTGVLDSTAAASDGTAHGAAVSVDTPIGTTPSQSEGHDNARAAVGTTARLEPGEAALSDGPCR